MAKVITFEQDIKEEIKTLKVSNTEKELLIRKNKKELKTIKKEMKLKEAEWKEREQVMQKEIQQLKQTAQQTETDQGGLLR